jgi:hypothetical protein
LAATGLKPTELAWAAGILDGEGCFTMGDSPCVCVESTSRETTEELFRILGGNCVAVNRRTNADRAVFRWRVYGKTATDICEELKSYLREKEPQAELLIHALHFPPRSAMRESIKSRLKKLKKAE